MNSDSIDHLLKPRFLVIGDYPSLGSYAKIGDVITGKTVWVAGKEYEMKNYPAIFRPLAWYEHREENELPTYVKFVKDYMDFKKGSFYKCENWSNEKETNETFIQFRTGPGENDLCAVPPSFKQLMPATLQQYEEYINKKP